MNNDFEAAVNTATKMCSVLSKLFYRGDHRGIEGVYLVFAGFDAIEAAASLGTRTGAMYIIPQFEIVDDEVELKNVLIADGVTFGSTVVHLTCNLVRFPDGSFGLMTDLKGRNFEYRCQNEYQLVRRSIRRPRNATKLFERGQHALMLKSERMLAAAA